MSLLASCFPDEFLERAVAGVPVEKGGWAELFLERTETLRGEWDARGQVRLSPGLREGFALRRVGTSEQWHRCEEGLDPDRILSACGRIEGASRTTSTFLRPEGSVLETEEKANRIVAILAAAGASLPCRLRGMDSFRLSLEWRRREIRVAPSHHSIHSDATTRAVLTCRVASPTGEFALGVGACDLDSLSSPGAVERLARETAGRLEEGREAREAPTGESVVVLAPGTGGIFLHEACGHALEADLVLRDASLFRHLLGERVAPDFVGAMDDSSRPKLEGSYACDDEGSPGRGTLLIARGILRTFLADRITGGRLGIGSTGNGRRESFRDLPSPRMSNTFLMAGSDDPEEIVRGTLRGIYVDRLEGGRVDTATGDFLFRAGSGRLIEGGRLTAPLRPFTIAGNGLAALKDLDRVGGDLSFGDGTGSCGKEGQQLPVAVGQPTIRIRSLSVRPG